jgi:hypothetical protein
MWALLGEDKKTVIGSFPPDISDLEVMKETEELGLIAVKVHIKNSPVSINGYYEDGKFYDRKVK